MVHACMKFPDCRSPVSGRCRVVYGHLGVNFEQKQNDLPKVGKDYY